MERLRYGRRPLGIGEDFGEQVRETIGRDADLKGDCGRVRGELDEEALVGGSHVDAGQ